MDAFSLVALGRVGLLNGPGLFNYNEYILGGTHLRCKNSKVPIIAVSVYVDLASWMFQRGFIVIVIVEFVSRPCIPATA